jgi:hypothetical protein
MEKLELRVALLFLSIVLIIIRIYKQLDHQTQLFKIVNDKLYIFFRDFRHNQGYVDIV